MAPSTSNDNPYVPFKNFFVLVSFVASVDMGLAVSASLSLTTKTSFLGRSDAKTLAAVNQSAIIFAWSACINGAAFVLSLLAQLLFTSPIFQDLVVRGPHNVITRWMVGSAAWGALALVAGGTALVGEGLKVIDEKAGAFLQWMLLAFGMPTLLLWIAVIARSAPSGEKFWISPGEISQGGTRA